MNSWRSTYHIACSPHMQRNRWCSSCTVLRHTSRRSLHRMHSMSLHQRAPWYCVSQSSNAHRKRTHHRCNTVTWRLNYILCTCGKLDKRLHWRRMALSGEYCSIHTKPWYKFLIVVLFISNSTGYVCTWNYIFITSQPQAMLKYQKGLRDSPCLAFSQECLAFCEHSGCNSPQRLGYSGVGYISE